jgi:Zn-dependent protease
MSLVIVGLILLIVLIFSLSIHEIMHGYVAYLMGDDTAKLQGRLTLNPLAHLDPLGTIMMLLAGFGWAKPVPVNYGRLTRFKNRSVSIRLVSVAGVTANFLVAGISYFLSIIITYLGIKSGVITQYSQIGSSLSFIGTLVLVLEMLMYFMYIFNLMLMAFNLLPIPPLDGYHFIETFLPYKWKQKLGGYERNIGFILLALILIGNFSGFSPLSYIITAIETPFRFIIETPVNALASILSKTL